MKPFSLRQLASIPFAVILCAGLAVGSETTEVEWEIPEDTNAIESLTPEQAREIAGRFLGVSITVPFSPVDGNGVFNFALPLNGLTELDAATAEALARYGDPGCIALNGVRTLPEDVGRALAKTPSFALLLNGITKLEPATARSLAEYRGDLHLNGLEDLPTEVAKEIGQYRAGCLSLGGLKTLSPEAAKELAKYRGSWLGLNGLTTLSGEAARELATFKGDDLCLDSVTDLSPEAATALGSFCGSAIELDSVTLLSEQTARSLACFGGVNCRCGGSRNCLPRLPEPSPRAKPGKCV